MSDGSDDVGVSEERIAELEERIEELSGELRSPPDGPFGLPRPPTPGEVLDFVDDHAIPTTIAILEANIRALRALRGAINLLRRAEKQDPTGRAEDLRDRTDSIARDAVGELDRAVSDLTTALEGDELPDDEEARSVLQEIRSVRDEISDALTSERTPDDRPDDAPDSSAGGNGDEETGDNDGTDESAGEDPGDGGVEIDVESELKSIKDEMSGDTPPGDRPSGNGDGSDGEED
jgi:hypothetical protein